MFVLAYEHPTIKKYRTRYYHMDLYMDKEEIRGVNISGLVAHEAEDYRALNNIVTHKTDNGDFIFEIVPNPNYKHNSENTDEAIRFLQIASDTIKEALKVIKEIQR